MANVKQGHHDLIQLPPDSTGKIAATFSYQHLPYTNGTIPFVEGEIVEGATSLATAKILRILGTTSSGELITRYNTEFTFNRFTSGENLQVGGVTRAVLSETPTDVQNPASIITSGDNPRNYLRVDSDGAAYVRYNEGTQQLDSFGLSRSSEPSLLAQYTFHYGTDSRLFTDVLTGAGAITHIPNAASIELSISGAAGDECTRTSNRYHLYQPGFGQLIEMTVVCGSSGKANLTTQWGYFDEYDGVFFEIKDGVISVVLRSSVDGFVEHRIPQSSWNIDKLDGSGLSHMVLNPTFINLYWMDFQWLGAGQVRMGVYDIDGSRITCHRFSNANYQSNPYMRSAQLPVRVSLLNTGLTAGPSSMRVTCMAVKTDGKLIEDRARLSKKFTLESHVLNIPNSKWTILGALRAAEYLQGLVNRKYLVPETMVIHVQDSEVAVQILRNPTSLVNVDGEDPTWAQVVTGSIMEISSDAWAQVGGEPMIAWTFSIGATTETIPDNFGVLGHNLIRNADQSPGDIYLIMCKALGGLSAVGSITVVDGASLVDGDYFEIDDGTHTVRFEFDSNGSVVQSPTLRSIPFSGASTISSIRKTIVAVMNYADLVNYCWVFARSVSPTEIELVATFKGTESNNAIVENVTDPGFVVTGMSGGTAASAKAQIYPTWIDIT